MAIVMGLAVIPAGCAWLLRQYIQSTISRIIYSSLLLLIGLALFQPGLSQLRNDQVIDREILEKGNTLRENLAPLTTENSAPLICADAETSLLISSVVPFTVMAPSLGNANPADWGVLDRFDKCSEILNASDSTESKLAIIRAFNIDYILVRTDQENQAGSLADIGNLVSEGEWYLLYEIAE
jgi:hypothetical protein